ncbi:hypothetical protein J7I86_19055 [Arthrobacter sp. ISL-95]|nr:hypothetical protein [Arthrobacter sp. ISL-95]
MTWSEPPSVKPRTRKPGLELVYEIPDFGVPVLGEIPDFRWARAVGASSKHKGAVTRALGQWLEDNPGYWVLVGTYGREKGFKAGTSGWGTGSLYDLNIPHSLRDGNIYAHSHLDISGLSTAESLQAALDGENGVHDAVLTLPKLEKDPFGWTQAELNLATAIAREWLYPTEELVAA